MSQVAKELFQSLLSWIRQAAGELYTLVNSGKLSGLLGLLLAHWKGILLVTILVGLVADLLVYWFRWRPYIVWQSFFRRLRHGRPPITHAPVQSVAPYTTYVHPEDDVYEIPEGGTAYHPEELQYEQPLTDIVYASEQGMKDEWEWDDTEDEAIEDTASRRQRRSDRRYLRLRLPSFLRNEEDEPPHIHYQAPKVMRDHRDAFHDPYIPPQWKEPEIRTETREKRRRRGESA